MKLFHTENGKEVVYVQMQDLAYLIHETDLSVPASIFMKVFSKPVITTDENRFNFVKFDEEHEIKFFKNLNFIIDYMQYKDLTDEQLEKEWSKIVGELNGIAKNRNRMSTKEREKNVALYEKHHNLEYMLKFIKEIYDVKHHTRTMPFPDFVTVE